MDKLINLLIDQPEVRTRPESTSEPGARIMSTTREITSELRERHLAPAYEISFFKAKSAQAALQISPIVGALLSRSVYVCVSNLFAAVCCRTSYDCAKHRTI